MKTPTVGDESSATGRRGKCNFLAQSSVMTLENWAVCWDERGWTSSDKDDEIFRRSLHIIQWTEFNGILVAVFLLYAVVMRNGWLESKAKPLPTTRKLWRVSTCQFTEIVYLYLWSFKMTQSNFCFRVAITDATALNGILDTICDTKACRSKLHYPFAIQILGSGWGGFEYRWGGNTNSERWKVNEMYLFERLVGGGCVHQIMGEREGSSPTDRRDAQQQIRSCTERWLRRKSSEDQSKLTL